jgi:hypothetical protein
MAVANSLCNMDIQDNSSFALKPSTNYQNIVLVANTAQNFTLANWADPNGKLPTVLTFSANGDFYIKWRASGATIPGSNIVDGSGMELNPEIRKVLDVATFSLIASANTIVTIGLYFR